MSTSSGRSLRRSRGDRWIGGVCGGLGEFFGIGAGWFRLAFVIALIPSEMRSAIRGHDNPLCQA